MATADRVLLAALDDARNSCAEGDDDAAVRSLLDVWGKLPSTRVAAVIDRLTMRLPRQALPNKVGEQQEQWLRLARSGDPAVVPTLLGSDWPVHPPDARTRLEALKSHAPDPRIAHMLHELWRGSRYVSRTGVAFWRAAFRLLLDWKDPETTVLIEQARAESDRFAIIGSVVKARSTTPLPSEPVLAEPVARALDELEKLVGIDRAATAASATSVAALFAEVYADPTSDAPRLVLADLLTERGDPRGELIHLMNAMETGRSSAKIEARVTSLLRASAKKWLDGLGKPVTAPRFRSGFVSEVTLVGALDPRAPAWRTVETLHLGHGARMNVAELLEHPHLQTITRLDGVPMTLLAALVRRSTRVFDRLGIVPPLGPLEPFPGLGMRVRQLAIEDASDEIPVFEAVCRWFDASPFRSTAKVLELDASSGYLLEAQRELTRLPMLDAIWLRPIENQLSTRWQVRLTREPGGRAPSVVEATWHGVRQGAPGDGMLAMAVRRLPPDVLSQLSLRSAVRITKAMKERLERELRDACARQPRVAGAIAFG